MDVWQGTNYQSLKLLGYLVGELVHVCLSEVKKTKQETK